MRIDESREMDGASRRTFRKLNNMFTTGTTAPPSTLVRPVGAEYLDTANNRLWIFDGTVWRFVRSIDGVKRAGVVLSASGVSIGAGVSTTLTWTTETSDVDGWIAVSSTTLTVPTGWGGCYDVTCRTTGSISSSSDVEITAVYNGTVVANSAGPFANAIRSLGFTTAGLAAGDTLTFVVFNGSGVAITFTSVLVINWLYP
jgi:hypothetical protein